MESANTTTAQKLKKWVARLVRLATGWPPDWPKLKKWVSMMNHMMIMMMIADCLRRHENDVILALPAHMRQTLRVFHALCLLLFWLFLEGERTSTYGTPRRLSLVRVAQPEAVDLEALKLRGELFRLTHNIRMNC
jgi:hypothetical protein